MHVVEVTLQCNNHCVFCAQGRLRSTSEPKPRSSIEAEVDALPIDTSSADTVAFVGGEPTLLDDLGELLARARSRGAAHVLVQTNGRRLANRSYLNSLEGASFDVSLHGTTVDMQDHHTGVVGSFKQTVLGLRRARAAHLPFAITTVVTRSNFRHLGEMVRLAHTLGARAVRFELARPHGSAARNARAVVPNKVMVRSALGQALGLAQTLGLPYVVGTAASADPAHDWFADLGTVEANVRPQNGQAYDDVRHLRVIDAVPTHSAGAVAP